MTHTFAELEVSEKAYDEIKALLEAAGYAHAFVDGAINMHGIGLTKPNYDDWIAPENTFNCLRRSESSYGVSPIRENPDSLNDCWRPDENSCSYCGSMNPDVFMARLENGDIELGSTDKGYKVYVKNAGGDLFRFTHRDDKADKFYGHGHPAHNWITEDRDHTKFYFQHLNDEQMDRFVELYNEQKLKFKGGFGFCVLPFFMKQKSED